MNYIDQVYAALIYVWTEYTTSTIVVKSTIMGFLIAFVVSVLKTRDSGKIRWIESTICGIFAGVTITGLTALGAPIGIAGIVAGMIGYNGSNKTITYLQERILGIKSNEDD